MARSLPDASMMQAQQCCFRRESVTVDDGHSPCRTRVSRIRQDGVATSDGKIGCCPTAGRKRVEYPPTRRNGQPQSLGSPRSFRGRLLASECVFHAVRDTGASKEKLAHSKSVTSLEARVRQIAPTESRMAFLRAVITGDRMPSNAQTR